jgi:hypothetical protein
MTPACMAALGSKLPENERALAWQEWQNRYPALAQAMSLVAGVAFTAFPWLTKGNEP